MEGLISTSRAAQMIAAGIDRFMLIDVGCSGGIDSTWRLLGNRLHAIGFDPNVENCRSLSEAETNRNVRYIPAFVHLDDTHPFASRKRGKESLTRFPWLRLAVHKTLERRRSQLEKMTVEEKTAANFWDSVEQSTDRIYLPDFFQTDSINDIDFFKVDIDGDDYDILNSISDEIDKRSILGVGMEVNYFGDDGDTSHTFHNTDRFMRQRGFDLFNLTVRKYPVATIPRRYIFGDPSVSVAGRPLQGNAIYIRDICAAYNSEFASRLPAEKILKIAFLFTVIDLPDHAAEALISFRDRVERVCDINPILDAPVEQAAPGSGMGFDQYQHAFERDDPMFYPPSADGSTSLSGPIERTPGNVDAEIEALKAQITALHTVTRETGALKDQIAALHNSTSWRVTAPMRGVMRRIRGY